MSNSYWFGRCLFVPTKLLGNHFTRGLVVFGVLIGFGSCKTVTAPTSRQKFTVADKDAKNFAIIIGSQNELLGVGRDVENVSKMVTSLDQGYDVHVLNYATKKQILGKADEISRNLSADSTVFFYYSGHGAENGELMTEGLDPMNLREVADRLAHSIPNARFKRFIAVIDACHSGQYVNGTEAMFLESKGFSVQNFVMGLTNGSGQPNTGLFSTTGERNAGNSQIKATPFEQGLVVAAARAAEESLDGGTSMGGYFTYSWKTALSSGGSKTIRDVLETTKQLTQKVSNSFHTPEWRAMPESLLEETIGTPAPAPTQLVSSPEKTLQ